MLTLRVARRFPIVWCIGALCLGGLAACAGNGKGLDQGGRPLPPGGSSGGVLTANFDSIQQNVFTPICSVCHAGSNAPQGLHLDAPNSYSQLVGVASAEVSSLFRVKASDPANSYLVQKIEGHAAVGGQMPLGGSPLPTATIAVIRQWISDGALRSPVAMAAAHFAVTSVTPAPGDVLNTPPSRIVIELSQDVDSTQLDATTITLEAVSDGAQVPVTVVVPFGNPRALVVAPLAPLAPLTSLVGGRHYRLVIGGRTVSGALRAPLTSVSGERLGKTADETTLTEFDVAAPR